jgi:hypothetical protein
MADSLTNSASSCRAGAGMLTLLPPRDSHRLKTEEIKSRSPQGIPIYIPKTSANFRIFQNHCRDFCRPLWDDFLWNPTAKLLFVCVLCYLYYWAGAKGLEPAIFDVTSRRKPVTH